MGKYCHACNRPTRKISDRYCANCAKMIKDHLKDVGYLQDTKVPKYFSDERGRKGMKSLVVLGGEPS